MASLILSARIASQRVADEDEGWSTEVDLASGDPRGEAAVWLDELLDDLNAPERRRNSQVNTFDHPEGSRRHHED